MLQPALRCRHHPSAHRPREESGSVRWQVTPNFTTDLPYISPPACLFHHTLSQASPPLSFSAWASLPTVQSSHPSLAKAASSSVMLSITRLSLSVYQHPNFYCRFSLSHPTTATGARSSGANIKSFKHNDPEALEKVIRASIAEGQPRKCPPNPPHFPEPPCGFIFIPTSQGLTGHGRRFSFLSRASTAWKGKFAGCKKSSTSRRSTCPRLCCPTTRIHSSGLQIQLLSLPGRSALYRRHG